KAKGRELARLQWTGDRITWKIGTGEKPSYREDHKITIRKLDGYLPIGIQEWDADGLHYTEEAFATLLRGPLSPTDPKRDEETSAVLMVRLTARSSGVATRAHVWISEDPAEALAVSGNLLSASGRLRAQIDPPAGATLDRPTDAGIHVRFDVPAGREQAMIIKLPFVSDLSDDDAGDLRALNY